MKYLLSFLFATVFFYSCKNNKKENPDEDVVTPEVKIDSTLITDSSWGFINNKLNFSDLKVIYGEDNIKDERICGPECIDSIDVTKVFPGTKNEAIVYWADSAYHKKIGFITTYSEGSGWHTTDSLKIGSSVKELLRLNGKGIRFSGFEWDYGGTIISYNNGKFEKSPVNFELEKRYQENDTSMALMGDIELSSDSPEVQKEIDKIIIRKISLSFNEQ